MVSNRRGPTSNCGCCAPPCTCLIAKETFRGVANNIVLSGSAISIPDNCYSANLTGSFSASAAIDYDDGTCGESTGDGICPARQSHYFGPLTISVGSGPTSRTTYLAGRTGNCINPINECSIVETGIDAPGECVSFNEYGQLPAYYEPVATAGVGISFSCDGGNLGTPKWSLYVSAAYKLNDWDYIFQGVPAAPTGWTRTGSGTSYTYFSNDGLSTLTLATTFRWYTFRFCNGVAVSGSASEAIWQLTAFTLASTSNATSVTLDYPFDPAGIFAGVTGTVT